MSTYDVDHGGVVGGGVVGADEGHGRPDCFGRERVGNDKQKLGGTVRIWFLK